MALDLVHFRQLLDKRREALASEAAATADDRKPVTLDQESVGRLSRIDAMQMQAMAMAAHRRREHEQTAIEAAVQRIKEGEYGYCLICGEDIALARLEHSPAVTTCIECARESPGG